MSKNYNIDIFKKYGYLKINDALEQDLIEQSKKDLEKIKKFCQNKKYNYIRVYEDYSEKINIAGIENIFHESIINQNVVTILEKSDVINIAKDLLNTEEIVMTLSRYHITENISHLGKWHRDGKPGKLESIQLNIYLYDESGFEIVPNSHVNENSAEENELLKNSPYTKLTNTQNISSRSCSVLAFHPSFLHRGKSIYRRAHIHLRFRKKTKLEKEVDIYKGFNFLDNYLMADETKKIILSSLYFQKNLSPYHHRSNIKKFCIRKIRILLHKLFFFLPYNSIFYKKLNIIPCLKTRKIFGIL